jgi:hypothetical protein
VRSREDGLQCDYLMYLHFVNLDLCGPAGGLRFRRYSGLLRLDLVGNKSHRSLAMDAVSTAIGFAASVDQLAGLAKTVASNMYRYCEAVKDAPTNAQQVRDDVKVLSDLLDQLRETVFDHEDRFSSSEPFKRSIERPKSLLAKLNGRVIETRAKGIKRFAWPFTKEENE